MKIETHHINFAVGPVPIEEEIAAVGGISKKDATAVYEYFHKNASEDR